MRQRSGGRSRMERSRSKAPTDLSFEVTVYVHNLTGLPTPSVSTMATLDDSWHMLEQSGRFLVTNWRANSCRRQAGSLVVLPEV